MSMVGGIPNKITLYQYINRWHAACCLNSARFWAAGFARTIWRAPWRIRLLPHNARAAASASSNAPMPRSRSSAESLSSIRKNAPNVKVISTRHDAPRYARFPIPACPRDAWRRILGDGADVMARLDRISCLPGLAELAFDGDPLVRMAVAERLPAGQLSILANDSEACVRFVVAQRIEESGLASFVDDPERFIREIAFRRLTAVSQRHVSAVLGRVDQVFRNNV
jgi:hypothetical protein